MAKKSTPPPSAPVTLEGPDHPSRQETKIKKLSVRGFLGVRHAEIAPATSLVLLSGKNGAGKSSVFAAAAALLGGAKLCPDKPIKDGADKAEVRGDFGWFEAVATWTRRRNDAGQEIEPGVSIKVTLKDGTAVRGPREFLSALFNPIALNPHGFVSLEPKEQVKALKDACGLTETFAQLDARREKTYEKRRQANQDVAIKKAQADTVPMVEGPDSETTAADLKSELDKAGETIAANNKLREQLGKAKRRMEELAREAADLEAKLKANKAQQVAGETWMKEHGAKIEKLADPDLSAIAAKLAMVDAANAACKQRQRHRQLVSDLEQAQQNAALLDREVQDIDAQKLEALAGAAMPVPGMSFTEEHLTIDGIPFAQINTARQMRAAVAIVAAQNPKLRTVFLDRGESLDQQSLDALGEFAAEKGFDVWVSKVTDGQHGVGFVIESGETLARNP